MGRGCSTHGREGYRILWQKPEGMSYREDLYVDERIILKWILES
jgi:hypothetical protein